MADEYIKRSGAIFAIQRYGVGSFDFEEDGWTPEQAERFVISALKKLPSEDVAPVVHGKWVREEYDGVFTFNYCSNCQMRLPFGMEWTPDYCPWCGSRKDGE